MKKRGPFQLQAAVAALHCAARTPQATDWRQMELLYGALLALQNTPSRWPCRRVSMPGSC